MNVPQEIWGLILKKTIDKDNCKKMYESFPESLKIILENEYVTHMDNLSQHVAIIIKNAIVIFKDEYKIASKKFENNLKFVRFVPFTNKVIVLQKENQIISWDYKNNETTTIYNGDESENIKFEISPCGKFIAVCRKENRIPIFLVNLIDNTRKFVCNLFTDDSISSLYHFPRIKFNPLKKEIAIRTIWGGVDITYRLDIFNYENNENIFLSNEKISSLKYDENGILYCSIYKKGICKLENYSFFQRVCKLKRYVFAFVKHENYFYYSMTNPELECAELYMRNIDKNKKQLLYRSNFSNLRSLDISRDGKKLFYLDNFNLLRLDINKKDIISICDLENVLLEEKIEVIEGEHIDVLEFDVK